MKTYLDGQLSRTDTFAGNLANTFNGAPMAIGSTRDGVEGFFHGVIDEVAIYSYALSASQVLSNFNSITPPTNTTVTNPPALLVSLWHAEGNAQDAVGTNHGTLIGGVGFGQGAVGQGFLLDGVNDYVQVSDNASLHLANELTLEMWFKRADEASEGGLIDKRNYSTCNFGLILSTVISAQLAKIESLVIAARDCPARSADAIKQRLQDLITRLLDTGANFDKDRLHQEAILIATRADIQEEIDRLFAHLEAARALMVSPEPAGRKFDFLSQEFNREANTLCSKALDKTLTAIGLELKTVIDQMREQVQNIE